MEEKLKTPVSSTGNFLDAAACLKMWLILLSFVCLFATPGYAQDVLWGLARHLGPGGAGTVFSMKSNGEDFTMHKAFSVSSGPAYPHGSLVQGQDGYFYGTTHNGGTDNFGTVFKIGSDGTGFMVLRNFASEDGVYPVGNLVQGTDDYLYGMTGSGGSNREGVVYKISTDGSDYAVLKSFNSLTIGAWPQGSLVQGTNGSFYGMTHDGGANNGSGTIFKINGDGTGFTVLRGFDHPFTDGSNPTGSLMEGSDGNFYGMAQFGGVGAGYGTVFKFQPDGNGFTVIKNFNSSADGAWPQGSLVQGSDGSFYGMTRAGGSNGHGTVFKINGDGSGFTVLRHLNSATDGDSPLGDLIEGADGDFYGITQRGGSTDHGTIFKVSSDGSHFSVLRHFSSADGAWSYGNLVVQKNYCTPPAPSFTASLLCAGAAANFTDASTGVAFGATYEWDVDNDGTTDYTTTGNISHTYATAGSYTAKLTIRQGSCEESFTQQLMVLEPPVASLVSSDADNVINSGDEVAFTAGGGTYYTFYRNGSVVQERSDDNTWSTSSLQDKAKVKVVVESAGGCSAESAEITMSVISPAGAPVITSFTPDMGIADTRVTIKGKNFYGVSQVLFDDVAAEFFVKDKYTIKAYVPVGAKNGPVTVHAASGIAVSKDKFKVTKHAPAIVGFSPAAGPVGAEVILSGANLKKTRAVSFNGVAATKVKVMDDYTVKVTVPAGAKSSKISITTKDGTDVSKAKFMVTTVEATASVIVSKAERQEEELKVYPNPFVQMATVGFSFRNGGDYTVALYDAKGTLVTVLKNGTTEPGAFNQVAIDGSTLAKGLYIIRLQSKDGSWSKSRLTNSCKSDKPEEGAPVGAPSSGFKQLHLQA